MLFNNLGIAEQENDAFIFQYRGRKFTHKFTDARFYHVDLFFIDGSTPSGKNVERFISVIDDAKGAVAVYFKAGLGRTGTLIACWMMKEFGLNAAECMAWLKICRPGSVIGPQQEYLVSMQKFCWSMSQNSVVQKARRYHVPDSTESEKFPGRERK